MKKALAVILAVCTAAVLLLTVSFYCIKNAGSGSLSIRFPEKTEPSIQAQGPTADLSTEEPTGSNPVNINTAGLSELMTLPGIGEVLAGRIIDYREEHGPFDSPAGLLNVSGIGEGKLEAILDLITTGGTT